MKYDRSEEEPKKFDKQDVGKKLLKVDLQVGNCLMTFTGIPQFTLLMWGHIKKPRK